MTQWKGLEAFKKTGASRRSFARFLPFESWPIICPLQPRLTGRHARAPPDVNLDIASLDGRGVFEKDLHKLYFVYISSKPEDWNFILEVSHPARARVPCSAPHSSPRSGDHLPRPPSVVLPALPQAVSCKAAPCA